MNTAETIPLCSSEGWELYRDSIGHQACIGLMEYFVSQDNLTFCGPATASMILNASGVERPESPNHAPYKLFTQESVFSEDTPGKTTRDSVVQGGVSIAEFGAWMKVSGLESVLTYADDSDLEKFRSTVTRVMNSGFGQYLAVNYHRPRVGQKGGGHISPLGLFHSQRDMVLVLDVARFKYPPHWVSLSTLFHAMCSEDQGAGFSRGWVKIQRITGY